MNFNQTTMKARVTVHKAFFIQTGLECYFINVTNLSKDDIFITHVYCESDKQVAVMQPDRPLPKRLIPSEPWETWVPISKVHADPYKDFRVRLSTGEVIKSKLNKNVPHQGDVPGGPIHLNNVQKI